MYGLIVFDLQTYRKNPLELSERFTTSVVVNPVFFEVFTNDTFAIDHHPCAGSLRPYCGLNEMRLKRGKPLHILESFGQRVSGTNYPLI